MRWIHSNGRTLVVREVGPVAVELTANGPYPLPILNIIEDDAAARERLQALIHTGYYKREEV